MFKQFIKITYNTNRKQIRNFGKKQNKQKPKCAPLPPPDLISSKEHSKSKKCWESGNKKEKKEKPPLESCRVRQALGERLPDPDLSEFNGQPYQTCGTAYIIQKDKIPPTPNDPKNNKENENEEKKLLEIIETDESLKNLTKTNQLLTSGENEDEEEFESVEKRLIKLSDLKLHPLYKRNLSIPKRPPSPPSSSQLNNFNYKTRSGPIDNNDIPKQLKIDLNSINKKNIFLDLKRIEPPKQLLSKLIEINFNRRPTLERKIQQTNDNKQTTNTNTKRNTK